MSGLRARLALAFSTLILVLLGLVALYSWVRIGAISRTRAESDLRMEARLLAAAARPALLGRGDPQSVVEGWGRETGGWVSLLDPGGVLVADSASVGPRSEASAPEVREALQSPQGEGAARRLDPVLGQEAFYVAVLVRAEAGGPVGVARIAVPVARLGVGAGPLRRLMVATTAVAGLLGLVLAYLVSRRLAAPFRLLTRAVETGTILREPVYAAGSLEAQELARGLNRLAERARETVAAAEAEHSRLASVLDTITEAIVVINAAEQVQLLNPAAEALLGVHEAEAQGKPLIEVVRDYEMAAIARGALASRRPVARRVELGAERRPVRVVAAPYRVGDSWQAALLAYDLTDVLEAQRLRREFLANVSHELRTPLAAVQATLEALEMGAMDDPTVSRSFLANARAEVERMSGLVEGLLEISSMEMGWSRLQLTPTAIGPVLERAVGSISVLAARAGVAVETQIPDVLPPLLMDPQRIHQVAVNLLHNAIKFTPSGGRVVVAARTEGDWLLVSVTDTGQGIAPEDLPTLFEKFLSGQRPPGRGAGLGLIIVRQIVEAHGGRVRVDSEVGRGSNFTFSLPLTAPGPGAQALRP